MTGIVLTEAEREGIPHWATGILNWLGMVQGMQSASGHIGKTYREQVKAILDRGDAYPYDNANTGKRVWLSGPAAIYGLYQSFIAAVEAEASK